MRKGSTLNLSSIVLGLIGIQFSIIDSYGRSFEEIWYENQREYLDLKHSGFYHKTFLYSNPFYEQFLFNVEKLITGLPNKNFLTKSCLTYVMVRASLNELEDIAAYEETFITECISPQTKKILLNFKEETNGLLDRSCQILDCASISLVHLMYIAKILESYYEGDYPGVILDIGGGFGNIAKILKQILPNSTIVVVDLPEMSIIQKTYLNYTMPKLKVVLHKNNFLSIEPGCINLVPICFLDQLSLSPDLLMSTFALSEAPESTQKFIINKNFFDAKKLYIAGQINGWKDIGFDWIVKHNLIIDAVREKYKKVTCSPMHVCRKNFLSYDIIAN